MRALPTIATRRRTSAMEPPPGKAAGRLCYAVTSARGSISHVAWRSQATSDCPCRDRRRRGHLQTEREQRREQQCRTDPRDTGCPAEALEKLAEDDAADDTAKEVAGKIDAARRSAVGRGRATDESGRGRLREERPNADQHQAGDDRDKLRQEQQRQSPARAHQRAPECRLRAEALHGAARQRCRDDRWPEYAVD